MTEYLRNCWYMAAWSHEIDDGLFRRRLLGEPVMLYRKQDSSVAAMVDRCPHRFAPLSLGTRDGDCVTCPYHGLTFDAAGKCVRNPFGEGIPKGTDLRLFPAIERDGIVWFWPGDPAQADEALVPDFSMMVIADHGAPIMGLMPMAANYQLGTDNLLDLSHIEFVHKGSFAGNGVIFAGQHEVTEEGRRLNSNWWMPGVPAPPHTFGILQPGTPTDHWLEMRWDPPASMYLQIGACLAGAARDDNPVIAHQAHILTPEDEHSTHYFWATTRGHPPSDEGDAMLRGLMEQAFIGEDKPIIEATYANMDGGDFWAMQPAFVGVDQAGTRARRKLEAMIKAE